MPCVVSAVRLPVGAGVAGAAGREGDRRRERRQQSEDWVPQAWEAHGVS